MPSTTVEHDLPEPVGRDAGGLRTGGRAGVPRYWTSGTPGPCSEESSRGEHPGVPHYSAGVERAISIPTTQTRFVLEYAHRLGTSRLRCFSPTHLSLAQALRYLRLYVRTSKGDCSWNTA